MLRLLKIACFAGLLAALAVTSGAVAAGQTGGERGSSAQTSVAAIAAPAAQRLALLRAADLTTRTSAQRYLRAIGLDPRQVVIQRGARNYAGSSCPGKGWSCTTARQVLQVGRANIYFCSPKQSGASPNDCVIVQSGGGTATCTETSGSNMTTQNCSITQTNTTTGANNNALVVQILTQSGAQSGTQTATQNASILQSNTKGGSNIAGVTQNVVQLLGRGAAAPNDDPNDADDYTPATTSPILQKQDAYQRLSVIQNTSNGTALAGNNTAGILQTQLQRARADNSPQITQLQNTVDVNGSATCPVLNGALDDPFANQCNTVQQSSSLAPNPGGKNTVLMRHDYRQFQAASNCCAATAGKQAQGSITNPAHGGLDHRFTQSSSGLSNQTSNQVERQVQRRTSIGNAGMTAEQHGPTRKGTGNQTGNANDTAKQTQDSRQLSTPAADAVLTNIVSDHCSSDGNCTGTQHVDSNGDIEDNTQSGSTINIAITCGSSSSCTSSTGFPSGDVFVSVGDGLVQERRPDGTLVRTLDTGKGAGIFTTGLALDAAGNLYVTDFNGNDVSKFDGSGTLVGSFGSGYNSDPESIVFDSSGNAYVGQADGSRQVLKFSPTGASLGSFSPATEDRGTDWIDLAPDQCTLYYTSEGTTVKRFNVCTNTQLLPDFATGLTKAFAVKVLPGGGALVADSTSIRRLDGSGTTVQQYGTTITSGAWFSLALDPGGTSFWAGNAVTGDVAKFDLASGTMLTTFNTGLNRPDSADGLVVAP